MATSSPTRFSTTLTDVTSRLQDKRGGRILTPRNERSARDTREALVRLLLFIEPQQQHTNFRASDWTFRALRPPALI